MPWPWSKRREEEERVKAMLRRRARELTQPGPSGAIAQLPGEPARAEPQAPASAGEAAPAALLAQPPTAEAAGLAREAGASVAAGVLPAAAAPEPVEPALPAEPGPPAAAPGRPPRRLSSRGAPLVIAGEYHGLDLTLFIGRRGRAIGFRERPAPARPPRLARPAGFFGRRLTWHVDKRNRRLELLAFSQMGVKRTSVLAGLLIALKWLFSWRIRVLVIERYIFGEAIGYFLLGTMGFTFFMIITSIFSLGEKIFSKRIPPFTIAKVLLLYAPGFLVLAIPVAVLFSTLMALGRLNRDNEIVAMNTTGVSLYRIFIPFVVIGIIGGLTTWYTYEHIVPQSNRACKDVLKVFWEAQVVEFIKPQIVIKAPQRKYFFVDRIDKTEGMMYGLRLYDYSGQGDQPRHFPRVYVAQQAYIENQYLVLRNVRLYNLDEKEGNTMVSASMPEVKIDIGTKISEYNYEVFPQEMTAADVRLRVQLSRDRIKSLTYPNADLKQRYYRDWTEYYFKFAVPVTCLVFVLVAVPVSLRGPRDERNLGIILSFLLVMIYWILYFSCRVVGSRGPELGRDLVLAGNALLHKGADVFPPYVAGWLPAFVFFIWGTVLIVRARK
jgi:lipopolysaccharide export LptBFGC system permease protein LptF